MDTYWVTFRLHEDANYSNRWNALHKAVGEVADQTTWWTEPTSFYMFKSQHSIDTIAGHLKKAVATDRDVVLVGMTDYKSGRLIGTPNDKDVFKLNPYITAFN